MKLSGRPFRCLRLSSNLLLVLCLCVGSASAGEQSTRDLSKISLRLKQSVGKGVVFQIDEAEAGLVTRFGPDILNACPQAPNRIGALGCKGCTWLTGEDKPTSSCSLEDVVGYYQKAAVSSWVFGALVVAGMLTVAVIPHQESKRQIQQAPRPRDIGLRMSLKIRKELALIWFIYFCSNFFFAFLLSYFVICDAVIAAQAHDATVLTLEFGLLVFTLKRYFTPSGRLKDACFLLHNHSSKWVRRLGVVINVILPALAFSSWLLSRRFGGDNRFFPSLPDRFDAMHYNLCYIDAFYKDARATTAIAYLKGFVQLLSALLFLLGGFTSPWLVCRILNLLIIYALAAAQFYYGRPVMRITGPMNIISEALAFDYVELAISHTFAVLGIIEHIEYFYFNRERRTTTDSDFTLEAP